MSKQTLDDILAELVKSVRNGYAKEGKQQAIEAIRQQQLSLLKRLLDRKCYHKCEGGRIWYIQCETVEEEISDMEAQK